MSDYIIGADIGGTWIRVALCSKDLNDQNLKIKMLTTPKTDQLSISKALSSLITGILYENDLSINDVCGIGIATAGPIDQEKGVIFNNANLGFKVIPLKEPLTPLFPDIPIFIINDANASALGIHYFEATEEEKDNLVYVTMSTGIGGGVICNGHLLEGKDGNAAEVGHGILNPQSIFQCNCGAYGCWEVYSSGTGVRNRAQEAITKTNLSSKILMYMVDNDISKITAKEVFQAARGADKFSKSIVDQCIYYTKVGVGLINNFYDCKVVYFGGSMMKDHDLILPPVAEQFETEPLLFTINKPPRIKKTKYLDNIGLRGAMVLVKYKLEGNRIIS